MRALIWAASSAASAGAGAAAEAETAKVTESRATPEPLENFGAAPVDVAGPCGGDEVVGIALGGPGLPRRPEDEIGIGESRWSIGVTLGFEAGDTPSSIGRDQSALVLGTEPNARADSTNTAVSSAGKYAYDRA